MLLSCTDWNIKYILLTSNIIYLGIAWAFRIYADHVSFADMWFLFNLNYIIHELYNYIIFHSQILAASDTLHPCLYIYWQYFHTRIPEQWVLWLEISIILLFHIGRMWINDMVWAIISQLCGDVYEFWWLYCFLLYCACSVCCVLSLLYYYMIQIGNWSLFSILL